MMMRMLGGKLPPARWVCQKNVAQLWDLELTLDWKEDTFDDEDDWDKVCLYTVGLRSVITSDTAQSNLAAHLGY
jgi:hypothetical protein